MRSLLVGKALMEVVQSCSQIQEEELIHRATAGREQKDFGSSEVVEVEPLMANQQEEQEKMILVVQEEEQASQSVVALPLPSPRDLASLVRVAFRVPLPSTPPLALQTS